MSETREPWGDDGGVDEPIGRRLYRREMPEPAPAKTREQRLAEARTKVERARKAVMDALTALTDAEREEQRLQADRVLHDHVPNSALTPEEIQRVADEACKNADRDPLGSRAVQRGEA